MRGIIPITISNANKRFTLSFADSFGKQFREIARKEDSETWIVVHGALTQYLDRKKREGKIKC